MNIIGIIASQRKEGNTAFIVNKILEGAKEQGAETKACPGVCMDAIQG